MKQSNWLLEQKFLVCKLIKTSPDNTDVKVLKSEHWKILSQYIPFILFFKLPIVIQEAFSELNID